MTEEIDYQAMAMAAEAKADRWFQRVGEAEQAAASKASILAACAELWEQWKPGHDMDGCAWCDFHAEIGVYLSPFVP